jgi:ribosome recycling factor
MTDWNQRMHKAVRLLGEQLRSIRPGKLGVGFIETFRVSIHGGSMPIGHRAAVTSRDDRIIITPFDRADVASIVKSLSEAKLNAYALNPSTVCVGIPPISGEQKAEIVRHVKKLGEEAKVAVRSIRQEARKQIAVSGRGSERAVQERTDAAVKEIERLVKEKIVEVGT